MAALPGLIFANERRMAVIERRGAVGMLLAVRR